MEFFEIRWWVDHDHEDDGDDQDGQDGQDAPEWTPITTVILLITPPLRSKNGQFFQMFGGAH